MKLQFVVVNDEIQRTIRETEDICRLFCLVANLNANQRYLGANLHTIDYY